MLQENLGLCVATGHAGWGEVERLLEKGQTRGLAMLAVVNRDCPESILSKASEVAFCDDLFSCESIATALAPYQGRLSTFINVNDHMWPALFEASVEAGAPFPGLGGQINARIKPLAREKLTAVSPIRWSLVETGDENALANAIAAFGLPIVLKPIWGSGSEFVAKAGTPEEALQYFSELSTGLARRSDLRPFRWDGRAWDPRRQIVVESFIPGREFSFEGYVQAGRVTTLMWQEKRFWRRDLGLPFETGNLAPTPLLSQSDRTALESTVARAVAALGLADTCLHIELKLHDSRATIVEVNPRMGGGSVATMLAYWCGQEISGLPFALALKTDLPALRPPRDGFLVGAFVNGGDGGVYRGLTDLDWVRSQAEFAFETHYCRWGQAIPPPSTASYGRSAWLYCYDAFFHCNNIARAKYLHDEVLKRVHVNYY